MFCPVSGVVLRGEGSSFSRSRKSIRIKQQLPRIKATPVKERQTDRQTERKKEERKEGRKEGR